MLKFSFVDCDNFMFIFDLLWNRDSIRIVCIHTDDLTHLGEHMQCFTIQDRKTRVGLSKPMLANLKAVELELP